MSNIGKFLQRLYYRTTNSIAFYPTLIAIAGLIIFFWISSIEYSEYTIKLKQKIPMLLITNRDEARLVVGTIVSSIITLMVFSFSMVMIVLTTASSSLSPRVLPGLISNKSHQVVLGVYLGTIIYSLLLIITFQDKGDYHIPSLGVLLAMLSGITCLCLFIYFIHSISKAIQVQNIVLTIHTAAIESMNKLLSEEDQDKDKVPDSSSWSSYNVTKTGYFKKVNISGLMKYAKEHDLQILIRKPVGFFVVRHFPFLKINTENLSDEVINDISSYFHFYSEDIVKDHYNFGFQQISEIAVKALSPGINDPGTAIKALDFLSILFEHRMTLNETVYKEDDDGCVRIIFSPISFHKLMFYTLIPIREYGKGDVVVLLQLLETLRNIVYAANAREAYLQAASSILKSCVEAMETSLTNPLDRQQIHDYLDSINELLPKGFRVYQLSNIDNVEGGGLKKKRICLCKFAF